MRGLKVLQKFHVDVPSIARHSCAVGVGGTPEQVWDGWVGVCRCWDAPRVAGAPARAPPGTPCRGEADGIVGHDRLCVGNKKKVSDSNVSHELKDGD
jgi:hypothetical protein